ncbi:hypothetical protein FBU30_003426 [Linnemannia zychae]|nr:hypothetical protein FBU30_003426 [Linnemannia zychae]
MSANSQQLRQPSRGTSDENRASAPTSAQKRQHRKSITKKRAHYSTPPPPPSLKKRALPDSVNAAAAGSPKKNTPLLLLPDSRSIWHTGTYQTVRWNRKYTKRLPLDTTVDVVLIDSKTNRKINSLKRFVPFKKGGCQVWVPTNLPESASFVLVLELYRGRSQEQVINTSASSSTSQDSSAKKPYHYREGQKQKSDGESLINKNDNGSVSTPPATTTDVFSRIMRRSEVNIAASSKKRQVPQYPPSSPYAGSNSNSYNNNHQPGSNPPSNHNNKVPSGTHHDINHDDFYTGSIQERPMDFLPDELRQEYPNTVRPLVLEHTFGLHQKVYTLTPYTLAWKIPDRVGELLEYTRQAQALFNTISKLNTVSQASAATWYPKSTFLAKVLVELVKDETMESVAIMAKDVPAETMFLYLSIQDRLPPAFYRLRVQMVVVQVRTDYNALVNGSPTTSSPAAKAALEGWEFPEGGEVIDRHEAITRKFWVSQGAL